MIAQLTLSPPSLPGYNLPTVPATGTRVILLRHGRSTLNDAGCYQGSSDQSTLTAKGKLASRQVGQYLHHCAIDQIYVSPLRRAQQTVTELLPQLSESSATYPSHPVTSLWQLREIDLPAWEGLRYDEVKTCFPTAYRCWQTTPEQFAMAQREHSSPTVPETLIYPVQEVYQRATRFWVETLPRHQGQTLLVVSHGSTIQALVNTAVGLPMRQHHAMQQTHSGLTIIDFATPTLGKGHLHLLNLTTPLGEQLPKLKAGKRGLRLVLLPCREREQADQALAGLVRSHPIAACVVEDRACCHASQRSLLADHPETVALSVRRTDFLHCWQRSVAQSLAQASSSDLRTVVAICHQIHAESFLRRLMGRSLSLKPNALTVLHYPEGGVRPILQALNIRPIPGISY